MKRGRPINSLNQLNAAKHCKYLLDYNVKNDKQGTYGILHVNFLSIKISKSYYLKSYYYILYKETFQ